VAQAHDTGRSVEPVPSGAAGLAAYVRTARPRQWLKNVLVLAAPGAAGVLTEPNQAARTAVAFACFCLAASGTYFWNDLCDREADRRHPRKRNRPIAAGLISPTAATATATGLVVIAIVAGTAVEPKLGAFVAAYAVLTIAYSSWLKAIPVVDLAAVAGGFILRTVAGGAATGVAISHWFLIVTSFGSLFMVAGKRHAEHVRLGDDRAAHRATLDVYSLSFLSYVRSMSSGVAITAYCLWAFERSAAVGNQVYFELSIIPFVIAVLVYALRLEAGEGGEPEELVLRDPVLRVFGLAWAVLFAVGVYGR
jgi:decaprenyl-phosphate phosphoribosyltransferase